MGKIRTMAEGDFLVVATDGALVKVMESTRGAWQSVPHMGGGWVIGIALKGTNVELPGVGRVEWVAAGAVKVQLTSWGVKASSYLAESGGMVAVMRALTQVSMDLSPDLQARRPDIVQYCDSQSLVRSIEGRMMDVKAARNSATRVWWPQIAMMLKWWRKSGAKWGINWRRGHVERREKNSVRWAPADWGNVIADVVAGQGWAAGAELLPGDQGFSGAVTPPGGHWFGRLKDEYVFNPDLKCFTAVGEEPWNELHGPLSKSMQGVGYTSRSRIRSQAPGRTEGSPRSRAHRNMGRPASRRQRG